MGIIYAWASPDYVLFKMSLPQVLLFYHKGIEAKKLEALIFVGTIGQLIKAPKNSDNQEIKNFVEAHKEKIEPYKNGYKVSI